MKSIIQKVFEATGPYNPDGAGLELSTESSCEFWLFGNVEWIWALCNTFADAVVFEDNAVGYNIKKEHETLFYECVDEYHKSIGVEV